MNKKIIRIISWGGLGDILLSTPSYAALKQKHTNAKIIMYCSTKRHKEVYKHNPHIDELRGGKYYMGPFTYLMYRLKRWHFYFCNYASLAPSINYNKNATEIIAEMFGVELKNKKIQIFLTEQEEDKARKELAKYRNPVILHITPLSSKNKSWTLEKWSQLVRSLPEYSFLQLGEQKEDKVEGAVDLRGATTFRESMAFIKFAKSFVGVDSSLSHVTNAFDIPGVVLFGASNPGVWGHVNNINLYKALPCAPCIDLLLSSPCPYGNPCMNSISVEDVREALLRQIGHR